VTLERLSRLRQGVYRLFGAGFSYPTRDLLTAAGGAPALFEGLGVFDYAFGPDVHDAAIVLAEADLDELSVAYVALFEAGVAGAACPPSESAHRSNARTGEVATLQSELKRMVMRFGLRLDEDAEDIADHIATEMDVMAMLCRRETELRSGDESVARVLASESELLSDHLLRWVPGFSEMVREADRHIAYSTLASAVRSLLAHEKQLLPLLVGESRGQG